MKRSIFRRIFLMYILVLLLALALNEIYITSAVRKNYIDNLTLQLSIQIKLISDSIAFNQANMDSLCRQIKNRTGARITVISPNGKVLGDSDKSSFFMESHSGRPEIVQALDSAAGISTRHSDTTESDYLYVAQKVMRDDHLDGFIRLAVPLKEIDSAVNQLRMRIILVVSVILLVTGAFFLFQTERVRRLLRQITDFSQSLARGEIEKRLFIQKAQEFDELAHNLNAMAERLQSMFSRSEEERERLNVILKSIPDALLIIDARGIIQLANSASAEIFAGEMQQGQQFIEAVRNREFADLVDAVRKSLSPGIAELRLDCPGERYLVARVSPLFYNNEDLSGFVAVFHDITRLNKLEQVRKDFVANVSHEIKTPITAIKGFADTLLYGALDDKEYALKFLRGISSNSERINSLVDDLMTISKIELGVIKVEKSLVEVEAALGNVMETLRDKAEGKGLSLRVSLTPELNPLCADRNRLIQIFTNLVDNAIKFTEKGEVVFGTGKEDGRSFLFVEDTGIGIAAKHLPRLGERFYRVDTARSRKLGGTGLGLAIVKHLIRAHGWEMKVESTPGRGTTIKIYL